jgi:hypothetical protein
MKWARYALPEGFAECEYPKDSNYHAISTNMMGRKDPVMAIRLPPGSANTWRNKSNINAKLTTTPYRRSTVLVRHVARRFYRKLGWIRKSIHKKFSLNVQMTGINRRSQIPCIEKGRDFTFIYTSMEYNKKLHRRRLWWASSRCFFGWPSPFGSCGRIRKNKAQNSVIINGNSKQIRRWRRRCNAPTLRTRWNICVKCYSLDQW